MAEYQKVMRERKRMCKQIGDCSKCQISFRNNKSERFCESFMMEFPEDAERIIMQWAAEHPIMTNRRKFSEVFGFDVATMFEVNSGNADWLDEEYQETE